MIQGTTQRKKSKANHSSHRITIVLIIKHTVNMPKTHKKTKPIINKSEVARRMGVSSMYVGLLLTGKRGNAERLRQIEEIVHSELRNFKLHHTHSQINAVAVK